MELFRKASKHWHHRHHEDRDMPLRLRNYWMCSIGFAVAWAIVLGIVAATKPDRLNTFLLVFAGVVIGWVSGTIARYVYPPPHKWTGPSTSPG
jgi:hypothetical protein